MDYSFRIVGLSGLSGLFIYLGYRFRNYINLIYRYLIYRSRVRPDSEILYERIPGSSVIRIRFNLNGEEKNIYIEYSIPTRIGRIIGRKIFVEYQNGNRLDITQPYDIKYMVTAKSFGGVKIVQVDRDGNILREFGETEIPKIN